MSGIISVFQGFKSLSLTGWPPLTYVTLNSTIFSVQWCSLATDVIKSLHKNAHKYYKFIYIYIYMVKKCTEISVVNVSNTLPCNGESSFVPFTERFSFFCVFSQSFSLSLVKLHLLQFFFFLSEKARVRLHYLGRKERPLIWSVDFSVCHCPLPLHYITYIKYIQGVFTDVGIPQLDFIRKSESTYYA